MWGASASHGRLFSPYHSRAHPTCLQQGVNSCRLRLICLDIRLSRPIRSRQTRSVQLPCSAQSSCKEPPLAWRHEAHGNRRGAGFRGRNTIPCGAAVGEAPAAGLAVEMQGIIVVVGEGSKRKEVLKDCYFSVAEGSLHMLLGANGCGKSTLLRVAGGLAAVRQGAVRTAQPAGFVFQNPDHQVVLPTAGADVAFGLGGHDLREEEVSEVVAGALAAVGLTGFQRRSCHTLSGGERQRLAIAGALAQAPAVLLLDELTSFLDAGDQAAVLKAVRGAVDAGGVTAIWVTHRLEELAWADGASYMDGGRIVVSGSVDRVCTHLRSLGALV